MRITGGRLRGREVPMPARGAVRPTPSRVREALFSMLGQDLDGLSAIDACAGAGLLGLEAWSRGAAPVTLVERDGAVCEHLRRTAAALGATVAIERGDARRVLAGAQGVHAGIRQWDLVLLDPPYADDPVAWIELGAPAARRCLVLEHRWGPDLPASAGALELSRHRRYGDTGIAIYGAIHAAALAAGADPDEPLSEDPDPDPPSDPEAGADPSDATAGSR